MSIRPVSSRSSDSEKRNSHADLSEWVKDVQRHLADGETVSFSPVGFSMWPALRPLKDTVCIESRSVYSRMDIVLAVSENPKGIFLHRIIRIESGKYILMGDSNIYQSEVCSRQGILGKVVSIRRGDKDVTASVVNKLLRLIHRSSPGLRRLLVRILNHTRR